jgi:anti-anti-sigma regulatory factor
MCTRGQTENFFLEDHQGVDVISIVKQEILFEEDRRLLQEGFLQLLPQLRGKVLLDVSHVRVNSAELIRAFEWMSQQCQQAAIEFRVFGMNDKTRITCTATHIDRTVPIHANREEALAAFPA